MEIIKPNTPKFETYKIDEFEMKTDQPAIKALERARDMAEELHRRQGSFVQIENPFHLEPAAQYVFMAVAKKMEYLEKRIEQLESELENKTSTFGSEVV
jgi:hypothetical protein